MTGLAGIFVKIVDVQVFFLLRLHGDERKESEEQKKQRSGRLLPSCLSPVVLKLLALHLFCLLIYRLFQNRAFLPVVFFR